MIKTKRKHSMVPTDSGVNYREIADTMTEIGFPMNHSSARNYVLRVMGKLVVAVASSQGIRLNDERVSVIAKSPLFQTGISELLDTVECERRTMILRDR